MTKRKDPIDRDYEDGRQNLHFLISKMMDEIEKMSEVAEETGNARAYEVLGDMIKKTADMNDKFMEHVRKKQIIDEDRRRNNEIESKSQEHKFIGTTVDLQRQLKKQLEDAEVVEVEVENAEEVKKEDEPKSA